MNLRTANKRRKDRRFWARFFKIKPGQGAQGEWSVTVFTPEEAGALIEIIPIFRRCEMVYGFRRPGP